MPTDYTIYFDSDSDEESGDEDDLDGEVEYITHIVTLDAWTTSRNNLAQNLFNNWRVRRSNQA